MKKKIGILGGTFDPPHNGHLEISKSVIKEFKFQKLIWAITKKNPFKKKPFYSLRNRILLCKNIVRGIKKIKIKSYDEILKKPETIFLINFLKKKDKKTDYFFIMGSDNLIDLHRWKNWREIAKKCKIIVFPRKGFVIKSKNSIAFKELKNKNLHIIRSKMYNISSSKIRKNYLR